MPRRVCFLFILLQCTFSAYTQPVELPVKVVVSPDHADWEYKTGEPAVFRVTVMQNSVPVKNSKLSWQAGHERMKPLQSATETAADGSIALKFHKPPAMRPALPKTSGNILIPVTGPRKNSV